MTRIKKNSFLDEEFNTQCKQYKILDKQLSNKVHYFFKYHLHIYVYFSKRKLNYKI